MRENIAYETSKYINIITAERGKISVLVRGSNKPRGRFTASTQIFCYSEFVLYEHHGKYSLNDASLIENYFYLCEDYTTMTLGTYILNAAEYLTNEEQPDSEMLRLTLNTLWALSHKARRDIRLIKGAFEMRLARIAGFAPNLERCAGCGKPVESERVYLNVMDGCILCRDCLNKRQTYIENEIQVDEMRTAQIIMPLDVSVAAAMQYSMYADMGKLYSFVLKEPLIPEFLSISEKYLENHIEHHFQVLDMLEF
ncbi:MAG: DNA repair protein RecO [Clostridiales bacterium]|nr:DNA repair protein RecO [Clostridiales bacterium]